MLRKSKKLSSRALQIAALLLSINVGASQVVEGADKSHQQVNISAKEQNRLAVEGRRITNVVPAQKGVITYAKDEALGALYFTLNDPNGGTATLFVSDDRGVTYKVVLTPKPISGEEIVLRPPADRSASAGGGRQGGDGRAVSYQRKIKDLVLTMADATLANSVESIYINREVPLWKEGQLMLVSKFVDGDLVGEKYRLTNVSPSDMLVVEQELYRKGVRAISIENHTLPKGAGTDIFLVRERKENE